MNEERIDSFFSITQLEVEQREVLKLLNGVLSTFNNLRAAIDAINSARSPKQLEEAVNKYKDSINNANIALTQNINIQQKAVDVEKENAKAINEVNSATKETKIQTEGANKANKEAISLYDKLILEYKQARKEALNLASADVIDQEKLDAALAKVDLLKQKLSNAKAVVDGKVTTNTTSNTNSTSVTDISQKNAARNETVRRQEEEENRQVYEQQKQELEERIRLNDEYNRTHNASSSNTQNIEKEQKAIAGLTLAQREQIESIRQTKLVKDEEFEAFDAKITEQIILEEKLGEVKDRIKRLQGRIADQPEGATFEQTERMIALRREQSLLEVQSKNATTAIREQAAAFVRTASESSVLEAKLTELKTREAELTESERTQVLALETNIRKRLATQSELTENRSLQKNIQQTISTQEGGVATEEQQSRLAKLQAQEQLLDQQSKELSKTIATQSQAFLSAATTTDALHAKMQELEQAESHLSESERTQSVVLENSIRQQLQNRQDLTRNKQLQAQLDEQIASQENGATEAQLTQKAKLLKEESVLNEEIKSLNATIRTQTQEFNAANGSIDAMQARVTLLQQRYEAMSEVERQTPFGQQTKAELDALEPKVKALEASMGKFSRNVGNYGQTFSGAFRLLEIELQRVSQLINSGNFEGKELSELVRKQDALKNATQLVEKEFTLATSEARAYKNAVVEVGLAYGKNSDFLGSFTNEVSNGAAKIRDLNKSVHDGEVAGGRFGAAMRGVYSWLRQIAYILPGIGIGGLVGLLLVPLEGLATILADYAKKAIAANDATAKLTKGYEDMIDALENSANGFSKASKEINELRINIDLANEGFLKKKDVVNEYNETLGKALGTAKEFNQVEAIMSDEQRTKAYVQMMFYKAAANYELEKAAKKAAEAEEARVKDVQDFNTIGTRFRNFGQGQISSPGAIPGGQDVIDAGIKARAEAAKRSKEATIKEAQDEADFMKQVAENLQRQAAELAKRFNINFFSDSKTGAGTAKTHLEKYQKDLKAQFDLDKKGLEDLIDLQRALANADVFNEYDKFNPKGPDNGVRLAARKAQMDAEKQLVQLELSYETEVVNQKQAKELEQARNTIKNRSELAHAVQIITENAAKERLLAEKNAIDKEVAIEVQYSIDIIKIRQNIDSHLQHSIEETLNYAQATQKQFNVKQIVRIEQEADFKQSAVNGKYNADKDLLEQQFIQGKISYERYQQELLALDKKYSIESINIQIDKLRQQLIYTTLDAKQREDIINNISKLEEDRKKQLQKIELDNIQKLAEERKKLHDLEKQFAKETFDLFQSLGDSHFDRESIAIQNEMNLLDKKTEKEVSTVNQSVVSQQQKEQEIAKINVRADAQKDALDKRQKANDEKKAKFDKTMKVLEVTVSTAASVAAIQTKYAEAQANALAVASNPFTAAYAPIAQAAAAAILTQIPFAIGIGAAQVAAILAAPTPKYFRGRTENDPYEGLAWVGDGGRSEAIIRKEGAVEITPATDTLTYVRKGDVILPDASVLAKNVIPKPDLPAISQLSGLQMQFTKNATDRILQDVVVLNQSGDGLPTQQLSDDINKMRRDIVKAVRQSKPVIKIVGESNKDKLMKYGSGYDKLN